MPYLALALYASDVTVHLFACASKNRLMLRRVTKCLLMPLLALCYVWTQTKEAGLPGWKKSMTVFTVLSVALFALFYPVLAGVRIPGWYGTYLLQWIPSWPF